VTRLTAALGSGCGKDLVYAGVVDRRVTAHAQHDALVSFHPQEPGVDLGEVGAQPIGSGRRLPALVVVVVTAAADIVVAVHPVANGIVDRDVARRVRIVAVGAAEPVDAGLDFLLDVLEVVAVAARSAGCGPVGGVIEVTPVAIRTLKRCVNVLFVAGGLERPRERRIELSSS
jgi:hypothetical protein